MEQYKDIVGYEGRYQISDAGNVLSLKKKGTPKPKVLRGCKDGKKYHYVKLKNLNGEYKMFKVHRLVAMHFIPNPENKPQVNHKDGFKWNNCVSNLEWATNSENVQHAFDTGLAKSVGVKHYQAKMNPEKVREIRIKNNAGIGYRNLSKEYGIAHQVVACIVNRKTWKHVL